MPKMQALKSLDLNEAKVPGAVDVPVGLVGDLDGLEFPLVLLDQPSEGPHHTPVEGSLDLSGFCDQFRAFIERKLAENSTGNVTRGDNLFLNDLLDKVQEVTTAIKKNGDIAVNIEGNIAQLNVQADEIEAWNFYAKVLQLAQQYLLILSETTRSLADLRGEIDDLEPKAAAEKNERAGNAQHLANQVLALIGVDVTGRPVGQLKGILKSHPRCKELRRLIELKEKPGPFEKSLRKKERKRKHSADIERDLGRKLQSLGGLNLGDRDAVKKRILEIADYLKNQNFLTKQEVAGIAKALEANDASSIIKMPLNIMRPAPVIAMKRNTQAAAQEEEGRSIRVPLAAVASLAVLAGALWLLHQSQEKPPVVAPRTPSFAYDYVQPPMGPVIPPAAAHAPSTPAASNAGCAPPDPEKEPVYADGLKSNYGPHMQALADGDESPLPGLAEAANKIVKGTFARVPFANLPTKQGILVSFPGVDQEFNGVVGMKPLSTDQVGKDVVKVSYTGQVALVHGVPVRIDFDLDVPITSEADKKRFGDWETKVKTKNKRDIIGDSLASQITYHKTAPAGVYVLSFRDNCNADAEINNVDKDGYLLLDFYFGGRKDEYHPDVGVYNWRAEDPKITLNGQPFTLDTKAALSRHAFSLQFSIPVSQIREGDRITQIIRARLTDPEEGENPNLDMNDIVDLWSMAQQLKAQSAE